MIYLDLGMEPFDQGDDLWWFFHLHHPCQQHEYRNLITGLEKYGLKLVGEQMNDAYDPDIFHAVLNSEEYGMQMTLFNASDAPHLFFGTRAEYVIPPDAPLSRLHADVWLDLGKACWREMQPLYGFAENLNTYVERENIETHHITKMVWAQFFGREFVRDIGHRILQNAPAWRNENLDDGGILYVLSVTPYQYQGPRQYWTAARAYFRHHLPNSDIQWSDMPI